MRTYDQLFIRACKSNDFRKRLRTLYRRIYLSSYDDKIIVPAVIGRLAKICDKYNLITTEQLLEKLNPDTYFRSSNPNIPMADYQTRCFDTLANVIRFTRADELPGLTAPARARLKISG